VSRGSITLGDVGEHTTVLAVACSRCKRAERYNLISRPGNSAYLAADAPAPGDLPIP
jgi:hypothetical protein